MKYVYSRIIFLSLVLCFFLSYSISYATQATLTWDPPSVSTDVTGYMIYYGTTPGAYSQGIDVGKTTSYTVSNLNDGQTYYFAATAYNHAGMQSVYSNEVSNGTPIQQYLLVISKPGKGVGTVSGTGINCGATCLALYNPATVVSLSAKADPGSTFAGWSGEVCSGTGLCITTINKATTITATFNTNIVTYVITATASGTGGTISPSGTSSVSYGGTKAFTITPKTGYRIAGVAVDGKSVGAVTRYTFSNITANHTITATFTVDRYVITATASGTGGTISPTGTSSVSYGGTKAFTITPKTGYRIAGVVVDGKSVGAVTQYTFSNITANHTITATFTFRRR
ncbi:MAG: fibronectin type III domain-containing protein [Syntrophales bacterium]|nr:fibronectin type III domain-containing protein [Syntrophales bacterium]